MFLSASSQSVAAAAPARPVGAPVRVSYIISTRNRAARLERTLANVAEFLGPEDELIVVDGASTDATPQVLARHAGMIALVVSEPDRGEAHGINKGALLARGEILKVLSDDDYIYPDAMRQALALMLADPGLDALQCGGEAYSVDPATGAMRLRFYLEAWVERRPQLCGLGLILRRRMLARIGLWDPSFHYTDIDYHHRLWAAHVNYRSCNLKLYRHHLAADSGTLKNAPYLPFDRLRAHMHDAPELPGGGSLIFLLWVQLWLAERAARSRLGRGLLRLLGVVTAPLQRLAGRWRPPAEAQPGPPPPEPHWDGCLR